MGHGECSYASSCILLLNCGIPRDLHRSLYLSFSSGDGGFFQNNRALFISLCPRSWYDRWSKSLTSLQANGFQIYCLIFNINKVIWTRIIVPIEHNRLLKKSKNSWEWNRFQGWILMCYMLLILTEQVCTDIGHFLSVSLANPIKFPTVLNMLSWPNKNHIHICRSSLLSPTLTALGR